jgi:FkbM family methyltransferase
MSIGLKFQESVRKPLIFITNVFHKTGFVKIYNQVTNPVNRFLFFTSPYFKSLNPDFIIDVGANSGEFLELMNSSNRNIPILAFEPIKKEFLKIQQRFQASQHIKIENKGLGSKEETVNLYVGDFSPSSSILKPETENYTVEEILITQLDNYNSMIHDYQTILCKIDVEGFEMEVLKGGEEVLKRIKYLYIEARTTEIVGCSFEEIYGFLIKRGWKYLGNYDTSFTANGKISHFDSLFENSLIQMK